MAVSNSDQPFSTREQTSRVMLRKAEIPKRLTQLHKDLGALFLSVHGNVDKAKSSVMKAKQAISDIREVLNQIWATLVGWSFQKCPDKWREIGNKQFENSAYHKIVAELLIEEPENRGKFQLLLDNMYLLYGELSDTSIGKIPLAKIMQNLMNSILVG